MSQTRKHTVVIDAHCHIGKALTGEELVARMDEAGIDKAVAFPNPTVWSLPGIAEHENTNDYIAEVQAKHPKRVIGFAYINPHLGAAKELRRSVLELGLRGIKIHPEVNCFTVDALPGGELMTALRQLQQETGRCIPVLCHGMTTIYCMPDQFATWGKACPDVTIIIAHGAGYQNLYFPSMAPLVPLKNVYVDTSMTTIDDGRLVGVTSMLGAERVIFGADHFGRWQKNLYGNFLYVLERAFPDPAQRKRILGGNMAKILGIPASA
jgi:predicted TIM-barrel fold metal-dependent hydrolase